MSKEVSYILASSVMAQAEGADKFALVPTIQKAVDLGADGCQLFINPERFRHGFDRLPYIKAALATSGLKRNIAHLPGYFTSKDLEAGGVTFALKVADLVLDEIQGVGKVCVIHHQPGALMSTSFLASAALMAEIDANAEHIVWGLENFHPPMRTNNQTIREQLREYLTLIRDLQEQTFPVMPVFDVPRLFNMNAQEQLDDPNYELLTQVCEAIAGQVAIIHATDFKTNNQRQIHPDNATRIGTGLMLPRYRKLAELGQRFNINWIGVVDESESQTVYNLQDVKEVKQVFNPE